MLKFRRYFLFFILFLIAIVGLWKVVFGPEKKAENWEERLAEKKILLQAVDALYGFWRSGIWLNEEELYHCEKSIGLPPYERFYLQCNPDYLDCLAQKINKEQLPFVIEDRKIQFIRLGKRHYRSLTRSLVSDKKVTSSGIEVQIKLKDGREKIIFSLPKNCHDVELPQRVYGHGPLPRKSGEKDWMWDSIGRTLWIDRFPVAVRDIREWQENTFHPIKNWPKGFFENVNQSARGLNPEVMKRYCSHHGKQWVQSHIFDAASFLPLKEIRAPIHQVIRGDYPWTFRNEESFLYLASRKELEEFQQKYCQLAKTKECQGPDRAYENFGLSWIGMAQTLGGDRELMENVYEPSKNLKMSSRRLTADSSWHRLGLRDQSDNKQTQNWVFRCMHQRTL